MRRLGNAAFRLSKPDAALRAPSSQIYGRREQIQSRSRGTTPMPPMRCARSRAWSNPPAHPRARLVPLDQHAGQRERPLREWVKRADADAGLGSSDVLMTEERAELARLRRDGDGRDRRLHRQLLQHATSSLTSRVRESYRVRIDESDSGTSCIVKLSAEREKVRGRARRAGSKLPDGGGR